MRRDGRGVFEIARAIGRSKSTVSRELKRNSCERFYRASTAQRATPSGGRRAAGGACSTTSAFSTWSGTSSWKSSGRPSR